MAVVAAVMSEAAFGGMAIAAAAAGNCAQAAITEGGRSGRETGAGFRV